MAAARKFEGLPDLDDAVDVYETPQLTDDLSTLQDTTAQSPSHGSDSENFVDAEEDKTAIDRRRLQTRQARTRFIPSRVDASDVDFSGGINAHGRSYRTYHSRRRRGSQDGDREELGDFSDEDDEDLDRKLARLRREVEQVKLQLDERNSQGTDARAGTDEVGHEDPLQSIRKISEALDSVYVERHGGTRGAEAELSRTAEKFRVDMISIPKSMESGKEDRSSTHSQPNISPQLSQVLSGAAGFDSRLSFMEQALGLNGKNMPDQDGQVKPILSTLEAMERLLQLATNSSGSLEDLQSKTRQLVKDAEKLNRIRSPEDRNNTSEERVTNGNVPSTAEDPQKTSKINALYSTLTTIDSISPSLPMVLDRLRSLRLLHANAAMANQLLEDIEKRQAEQGDEIRQWRDALEKVEGHLDGGEKSLLTNAKKMDEWVKALEARLEKF